MLSRFTQILPCFTLLLAHCTPYAYIDFAHSPLVIWFLFRSDDAGVWGVLTHFLEFVCLWTCQAPWNRMLMLEIKFLCDECILKAKIASRTSEHRSRFEVRGRERSLICLRNGKWDYGDFQNIYWRFRGQSCLLWLAGTYRAMLLLANLGRILWNARNNLRNVKSTGRWDRGSPSTPCCFVIGLRVCCQAVVRSRTKLYCVNRVILWN